MPIIPNINNQSIAILSDIEQWKEDIADAINSRGGVADASESFQELAEDITQIPSTGIFSDGVGLDNTFSFLKYVTSLINNEIISINDSTITEITRDYAFPHNIALREVIMNGVTTISGSSIFQGCNSLQLVDFPNLTTISGNSIFLGCNSLQSVIFGTLLSITEPFYNAKQNLGNITIGQDTDIDLPFQNWTTTNVIAEGQSGIDKLNSNLYNNLLTKLYDHSSDGETRILQIGWLDYITPENIAYANAKGWTITN